MKFISWNVNGLRACVGKGFTEFLLSEDADLFCVQETKLQEGQIALELPGYHQYWNYAEKKGYSGTAIFTKKEPLCVSYGIGIPQHDHEGRVITLEYPEYYFITVYTPNSQNELARLDYRMQWEDDFLSYLQKLEEKKPKRSFWDKVNSVLDKANDALNSFADAASSNSTINKLDEVLTPAAQAISESGVNDGGSNAYAESYASSGSVSSLEGQLASIDTQIQANRQQAQQLLKERSAAKQQVRSKTYTSTKRINQSDIARNGSPSRMRSRADGRAAATVNERNRLSGINTQLDRLNREWEQLLQARKEVASQIEAASDDYSESDKDTSKSDRYKELSKESQAKVKKSGQHSQTVLGKRRLLDKIADNLRDRKDNPEKYSHESSSQFRSEVRKLKEKARKIIAENNADGMEQLSFPSELLNWNP